MKLYALVNVIVCIALAIVSVSGSTNQMSNFHCKAAGDPHFTTFGGCRHHYPGIGYSTMVKNELFSFDFLGSVCNHGSNAVVASRDRSHLLSGPSCMDGFRIEFRLNKDCPTVTTHVLEFHQARGLTLNGILITTERDLSNDNSDYRLRVIGQPNRIHSLIRLNSNDGKTVILFRLMRRRFIMTVKIPTLDTNNVMLDSHGLCGPIDVDDCAVLENRNGEMRSCNFCEINDTFSNRNLATWQQCNEFLSDWYTSNRPHVSQSSCPVASGGQGRRLLSDELDNDDEDQIKKTFAQVQRYAQGLGTNKSDLMCSLNEEFVQVYDLCAEDLVPADGLNRKQRKQRKEAHLTCLVDFCVMHDLREALADANEFNDEMKLEEKEKNE